MRNGPQAGYIIISFIVTPKIGYTQYSADGDTAASQCSSGFQSWNDQKKPTILAGPQKYGRTEDGLGLICPIPDGIRCHCVGSASPPEAPL